MRSLWESEKDFDCGTCGQTRGNPCHKKDGKSAGEPQWHRVRQWYDAGVKNGSIKEFRAKITA